jgi:hypothetical protein
MNIRRRSYSSEILDRPECGFGIGNFWSYALQTTEDNKPRIFISLNDITPQQRQNPEVDWHANEILNTTEEQILELARQKNEITRRMESLKRTANALIEMFGEHLISPDFLRILGRNPPSHGRGFTDACRQVLLKADKP